jgi:hypothetical protein
MNQKELDSWNVSNEGIIWQLENNDPAEALDIAIDARKEIIALTTPQPEASDREMVEEIVRHVVCWMIANKNTEMMDNTDVDPTVKSIMEGYTMASADWSKLATIRADERRKAKEKLLALGPKHVVGCKGLITIENAIEVIFGETTH